MLKEEGVVEITILKRQGYSIRRIARELGISRNTVRANMVKAPGQYRWSSFHLNGLGESDDLVEVHSLYLSLGKTNKSGQAAYKALFELSIEDIEINDIRKAWQTGTPLGNNYFREKVESKLGCKAGLARRGRPKKGL